jgi:hypothetical protein
MISKHDVVSDSKLAEWQVDISGKGQHVILVQQYATCGKDALNLGISCREHS